MAKCRILSLDGGGLRGLITARILQRLNDDPKIKGWLDDVDLFAGTSTGGILALGQLPVKPRRTSAIYISMRAPEYSMTVFGTTYGTSAKR